MSIHGSLRGKQWSSFSEELGPGDTTGAASRPGSPGSLDDDVMRLSREHMQSFGQCPAWDRFVLVTCDKCGYTVKIAALESHTTLRHGSKSERNAFSKVMAAKVAAALKTCQVKLTPMSVKPPPDLRRSPGLDMNEVVVVSSGSSSSTSPQPPYIRPVPSIQPADSASAPESRSSSPMELAPVSRNEEEEPVVPMDVDPDPVIEHDGGVEDSNVEMSEPTSSSYKEEKPPPPPPKVNRYLAEEADSTTNNVISIPDDFDIPNIEIGIISEGGEGLNSINTKFNVALLKNDPPVDSTTATPKKDTVPPPFKKETVAAYKPTPTPPKLVTVASGNTKFVTVTSGNYVKLCNPSNNLNVGSQVTVASPAAHQVPVASSSPAGYVTVAHTIANNASDTNLTYSTAVPSPQQRLHIARIGEGGRVELEQQPTQYIAVSPLAKSSPKKIVSKNVAEKKISGREREYHPDRHCGVWDAEAKRNCTRSLTCKSHSVYLKRKVPQRTGPFDDLLAAHKAAKEAEQAKSMEGEAEPSILQRRLAMPPGVPHTTGVLGTRVAWEPVTIATGTGENRVATLLKQIPTGANVKKPVIQLQQNQTNDFYTDENLHYTTDHPKPLAVCTFGGKRVGGLFFANRSQLLARKVMRVAISSSGIQRLPLTGKIGEQGVGMGGVTPVKRLGLVSAGGVRQQTLPYIVNFQGGGPRTVALGPGRVGTVKLTTAGTNHIVVENAFKTDIQDFKGGIKFELPRKIQQILPTGAQEGPG